jgi:large subunit ribosomal protein L37Ae
MTHGTKKVGIAGKYGARYGVKIRKRLSETESERAQKRQCPRCMHVAVKRTDTGIWVCRHCDYKYAAGAYVPKIREFKREDLILAEEELVPPKVEKRARPRSDIPAEEEIIPEEPVVKKGVRK